MKRYYTGVLEMGFPVSDACLDIICVLNSYLAWASLPLIFLLVLLVSTLTILSTIQNVTGTPGCACGLFIMSFRCLVVMECPLIGGFVEYQHGRDMKFHTSGKGSEISRNFMKFHYEISENN